MAKALTTLSVEKLKPDPNKRLEEPDGLLPGLYLIIQPKGAKSWAVRYRHAGKPKKLTLGPYPALDLATAREHARDALRAAAAGRDPAAEKQARRSGQDGGPDRNRVASTIEEFLERHVRANNKPRTAAEVERVLRKDVIPRWGGRPIQDITRADVIALLDDIVDRGAPVHANRVLAFVRKFFGWAEERGHVDASPCTRVRPPTAESSRDRVLSDDEIRLIWKAAERAGWPFGSFVQFLILTGQRREEVAGMRWSEIRDGVWRIEAGRTKNSRAHDIPLSDAAQAVLASLPRTENQAGLVFTTTGKTAISGYSKGKARLDQILSAVAAEEGRPVPEPWRFHDLRRTVATGLARLGQPVHVVEAVLNHRSGTISGVAAIYNRHSYGEEKRRALQVWGKHIHDIPCK